MVRFLYTGSNSFMNDQNDPERSLGGYCSKSIVPNRLNNIFSDISYLSKQNETEECRAIVLENNSGQIINELFLGYFYDKELYDIQIAVVELSTDGKMEIISNSKDIPYYAEFEEAFIDIDNNIDNSLFFENFDINKKIGIWIKRKIKPSLVKTCQELDEINISNIIKNLEFKIKCVTS